MLTPPKQPAYFVLHKQGRTIAGVARVIDVSYLQLRNSVYGRTRPNQAVRDRLPALLGVALSELFTPDALIPLRERPTRPAVSA